METPPRGGSGAVPGGQHGCVAGMLEPCGRPATLAGSWPWSCHPAPICADNAPSAAAQRTRRARGEREGNRRLLSICASVCLSVRPPLQHIHQSLHPSIPRTQLLLHPAICPAPGAVNLSVSASPTGSSLPWGALSPDPQGPPNTSILVPGALLARRLCARHGHCHCHRTWRVKGGQ